MKNYLIFATATYFMGMLCAQFVKVDTHNYGTTDKNKIELFYSDIRIKNRNKPELVKYIIKNNLNVLLINFVGIFSFGVLSCINTAYNGFTLGYILKSTLKTFAFGDIIRHILPHSIELVGLIMSAAIGYYGGVHLFRSLFFKQGNYKLEYKKITWLAVASIAITIFAGVLEVYVSMD